MQPRDFAAEQWTGWRAGVEGAKKDYGAGQARAIGEFWERFPPLAAAARSLYSASGGDKEFQRKLLEAWTADNAKDKPPRPAAEAARREERTAAARIMRSPLRKIRYDSTGMPEEAKR